jgi:hypothetical protein
MRRDPYEARRRLLEFERLVELGVTERAAFVLADALAFEPWRRGDTAAAYNRHRRHASPSAREARPPRTEQQKADRARADAARRGASDPNRRG